MLYRQGNSEQNLKVFAPPFSENFSCIQDKKVKNFFYYSLPFSYTYPLSLDQEAMCLIGFLIGIILIFLIIVACFYKWRKSSSQILEKENESTEENIEQSQHQNPYVVCDFSINH